jgi:hypothetical protein
MLPAVDAHDPRKVNVGVVFEKMLKKVDHVSKRKGS